jgi:uncharacterized protein (DUF362 family)
MAKSTRREFLGRITAAAAGAAIGGAVTPGLADEPGGQKPRGRPEPRVAIARDDALTRGAVGEHAELLGQLLNAAVQKVTADADAATAWRKLFKPGDRVGIKVNSLGLPTQPAVVEAIVAGLILAGVSPRNIIIWDRFDTELAAAGYKLNKSAAGVQCRGTDAERIGGGYQKDIETSGRIGSCYSKIVAEEVDALICVPVLKDHNLAGASLGMKNFYGAIHNPNKYHSDNCDPFVADVVAHRLIASKWRLTVCDATRAQYNAGPARNPAFGWPFGGLIVGADFVAVDAVGAGLIDTQRKAKGLKTLAEDGRPAKHIMTAAARGLGVGDLSRIERIEV